MGDRHLPARGFWKNAIVRTGSVQPFLSQLIILKKVFGVAGTYYFILFAGACPPVGIDDAGKIIKDDLNSS
ncbi:hypothetical protein [Ignatzschineria cameli]|uniref:Uncharacterized protein n=2 Tax=Ignatzschineria cameli TaxID=2182793 RepID=A0A2U2AL84_9GAMM|nr:hypothetical protein [Ignatzschineria cameli]PWD83955.1 hypothetical protein DC077_08795 [Ignatzschineria cameli]PWD85398.1 hypothetical protein DC080_07010 [Ignatzschineria cameli]PWD87668.1 hypothetical protein DC079_10345 [Ignatzschineria cameli]PWD88602.1 hypothetical protein DC081_10490 [Ignatzschineria cameli]PWD88928.1 hypothetical protein DC078_10425 [Ignatzschineria cameli]